MAPCQMPSHGNAAQPFDSSNQPLSLKACPLFDLLFPPPSPCDSWSFINTLPPNIDRESSGTGYHIDFGGFVYYIHPTWDESWGGNLLFQNCDVDKIEPKPNRFVWINPKVPHGIEVVNDSATHNRITIVGWPEGCIEYPEATQQINITY